MTASEDAAWAGRGGASAARAKDLAYRASVAGSETRQ